MSQGHNIPILLTGSININDSIVYFRMRKNKRIKRGRLVVSPEEGLVVETKDEVSLKRAHKMIYRKKKWVIDALESIQEKRSKIEEVKNYTNSVLLFGDEKIVQVKRGQSKNYILETKTKIVLGFEEQRLSQGKAAKTLEAWLKERSQAYLPLRVKQLNRKRFPLNKILIKDQKTIWGSCSSENNLNLNWRLIMAPKFVSDYIIYHELCHTKHLDHSDRFWNLVGKTCPRYKEAEKWLHNYGFILHLDFEQMV